MDDMAPGPTQRTYDDVGRVRDENFGTRKRGAKKALPAPPASKESDPEIAAQPEPEPEANHELDLLA